MVNIKIEQNQSWVFVYGQNLLFLWEQITTVSIDMYGPYIYWEKEDRLMFQSMNLY